MHDRNISLYAASRKFQAAIAVVLGLLGEVGPKWTSVAAFRY